MNRMVSDWFEEVKELEVGEALFFRVPNKKEQTKVANEFEEEKEEFAKIDPVHASQLFINKTLMDMKQYVVVERKYRAPFTAFHRDINGKFSKVSIDPERKRIIKLMIKDGKPRNEVEEVLNGLTDEEIAAFYVEDTL